MNFINKLSAAWTANDSLLCVGLDPDMAKLPAQFQNDPQGIYHFCREIIDATADLACSFKPQIAYFAALSAEDQLEKICAYARENYPHIPLILDAKRGDIGSTAQHYATEAFERYRADAVTLNPYLGRDSIQPFLDHADKGVILLCRTSNPGGADFQALDCGGLPLYLRVAETVARDWNANGNCALVTGATWPEELGEVRAVVGDMPLLVPGIGAQGGDVEAVLRYGRTAAGTGLLISSSRAILYAGHGEDFAAAARAAAGELRDAINRCRRG